jgi:hypothetical protein
VIAAANKKTNVDITSGGNVDSESWINQVSGYIESWYAGQGGGTALAEILRIALSERRDRNLKGSQQRHFLAH